MTQDTTTKYVTKEVVVHGFQLHEEQLLGANQQPEWTFDRRFPSTRVYIQTKPGEAEFEQWIEVRVPPKKEGGETETRLDQELEFGISDRVQLDIYVNTSHMRDEVNSSLDFRSWSTEVRWAPAAWNAIFGNPTLYLEYSFCNGGADKVEPKLLLGGELASRWHWATNLAYEHALTSKLDRDDEYTLSAALSYTISDQGLSVGPALKLCTETVYSAGKIIDSETANDVLLGPSVQCRLNSKAFLDFEPLVGLTNNSKPWDMFLVFGWKL